MAIFKGAGVAIVTPMKENEEVNYDKLEELVEWQIEQGTDAIVIVGTTGESSTLTTEEHSDVIRAAVRFAKHRVPVIAGTGSNCTREAIHLSEEAEKAGADGLLAVTPYYNKATQGGLIRYYTEIAEAVKLPIIMYNVPGRTGCNIMPETAATLFKNVENIVGIKEATGSLAQASRLMYLTDGKIDLYSGEDGIVVPLMAIGAIGVISVWSNVAPADVHDMCAAFSAGGSFARERTAVKGTAACGCAVFRGKPDSGEESIEFDGTGSGTASFPAHGDDTGECREACRSDEKLRNKVSIKEQMTPAEGSRKDIRRSMCLHRRLHAARGAGSTEKRG